MTFIYQIRTSIKYYEIKLSYGRCGIKATYILLWRGSVPGEEEEEEEEERRDMLSHRRLGGVSYTYITREQGSCGEVY